MEAGEGPSPDLSFAQELPLTRKAIEFAQEHHGNQRREADRAPFLVHPLEVASYLERAGYPDHVVAVVSDDPEIPDEEQRKNPVRERVRRAGGYAQALYAADKVSKVRELRMLLARGLDPEQASVKLHRYRKSLEMVEHEMPDNRVVELLRFELEALESLPPDAPANRLGARPDADPSTEDTEET